MNRLTLLLAAAFGAFTLPVFAQNVSPTVTNPVADFTVYAAAPARSLDLASFFADPDASSAVRMTTVVGTFDLALFGQQKPTTVNNFLRYVDEGRYFKFDPNNGQIASSFIHRSEPGFIIQGGGFIGTVNAANTQIQPTGVAPFPMITNEPGIPNTRGTIAMAKVGGNPNSATSQWFINLANNGVLDNPANNGGYTVFGRVVSNGMTVVDAIAAILRYDFSNAGPDFARIPLRNYDGQSAVQVSNLVSIPGIERISPLSFSATSDNANVTVTVSGTKLL